LVADPNHSREDAGVLLSVVLDDGSESSYLLVLDAETMA
jgi:carotenoid cleavage dioxygenase-like enzyme